MEGARRLGAHFQTFWDCQSAEKQSIPDDECEVPAAWLYVLIWERLVLYVM